MGDLSIFSKRLKMLRNNYKMTQREFAEKVGCTAATLSAYENGTKNPSLEIVSGIATSCQVSIDWLCGLGNERWLNKDAVSTYSDIIKICQKEKNPIKAAREISQSLTKVMDTYIREYEQMENLKKENIIDQEIYDLWLEKTLKKNQRSIVLGFNDEIFNPFTGESIK